MTNDLNNKVMKIYLKITSNQPLDRKNKTCFSIKTTQSYKVHKNENKINRQKVKNKLNKSFFHCY